MAMENKHILEVSELRSVLDQGSDGSGATELKVNQSAIAKESSAVGAPYRWGFRDDKDGTTGDYHECVNQDITSGVVSEGHVGYYNDRGELSGDDGFIWDPDNTKVTLKEPINDYDLEVSIDSSGNSLIFGYNDITIKSGCGGDIYIEPANSGNKVVIDPGGLYLNYSEFSDTPSVSDPASDDARIYWDNSNDRFFTRNDASVVRGLAYTDDLSSFIDGSGSTDRLTYWTDTDTISYVPVQYYDSSDATQPNTMRYYVSNDDGTEWPSWGLHTSSASPAVGDVLGEYKITGYDTGLNVTEYAVVRGKIYDPTVGAEYGKMELRVMQGGSAVTALIAESDMDTFGNEGVSIPGKLIVGSEGISSSSSVEIFGSGTVEIRVDDTMEVYTDVDMEGNPIDNIDSLTLDSKVSVDTPMPGHGRLWYAGVNQELIMTVWGAQYAIIRGPDDQASTDHALVRWDNTRGSLVQDSRTTLDDSGNMETATVASTQIGIRYETGDGHIDMHVNTDGTTDIDSHIGLTISCSCSGDITLDAEDIYLNPSSGNDVFVSERMSVQPKSYGLCQVYETGNINDGSTVPLEDYINGDNGFLWVVVTGGDGFIMGNTVGGGWFYLRGSSNQVDELSDFASAYATTDTASSFCVIADGDGTYSLKNNLGFVRSVTLMWLGTNS